MKIHGGDIYNNHVKLDFSVNVNPLGIPENVKKAMRDAVEHCDQYPDISCRDLKKAVIQELAEEGYRIEEGEILFGNGASELFMAIVHALRPKKALLLAPSFYGYSHAMHAVEGEIEYCYLQESGDFSLEADAERLEQMLMPDMDLLFLANPNNPTGKLTGRKTLGRILEICRKKKIQVVMDECFLPFSKEEESMMSEIHSNENLLVVRAFTKIYAIPGVRLGYLVSGNKKLVHEIEKHLPEWNLSGFAQAAGIAAVKEKDYAAETKSYVKKQREYLQQSLRAYGFRVIESQANYILFYTDLPLYELLLAKEILIRDCSNYEGLTGGYYRIAVKKEEENKQLLKAIGECIEEN